MPKFSLLQTMPSAWLAVILFALLVLAFFLGHHFRILQMRRKPELEKSDLSTINGMLLGLLGLMLAFTFSMSNERFDTRRELVIEEANDIGTVVLRTDVFPDSVRRVLRSTLKLYVDERIAFYEVGMNLQKAAFHYFRADSLSTAAWITVTRYARHDNITVRTSEIIPALNAMIDVTTTRRAAGEATLPVAILYFLFFLCLSSAFLLGFDLKGPINWVVVIGFAIMLSSTVFTIIDLDRPRSGLVNLDGPHQRMVDLRGLFNR